MNKEPEFKTVQEAMEKLNLPPGNYKSFCGYLHKWTKDPRPEAVFFNGKMIKIL